MQLFETSVIYYNKGKKVYREVFLMAKAVPVRVTLSKEAVDTECLRRSLETVHMCVVTEVVLGENYSEQQAAALLNALQKRLMENETGKRMMA